MEWMETTGSLVCSTAKKPITHLTVGQKRSLVLESMNQADVDHSEKIDLPVQFSPEVKILMVVPKAYHTLRK